MLLEPKSTGFSVRELNDFRAPSRRPWLLLLVLAVLVVGIIYGGRTWRTSRQRDREAAQVPEAATAEPAAVASAVAVASSPGPVERPPPVSRRTSPAVTPAGGTPLDAAGVTERLAVARDHVSALRPLDARLVYFQLLKQSLAPEARGEVEERLGALNIELATTPAMMPEKIEYAVRGGDSLQRIANRFGTTVELIQVSNRIANPNRINVGDRLRVLNQPQFALHVRKRANDLLLTLNGNFFKRYRVGTGEYGKTPEGTFVIRDRIPEPPWWRPDGREIPFGHSDNILGTRWMSIVATGDTPAVRGYGIHGTWDESAIGTQSSAGCVRMRNAEVEELFMLVSSGTPVTITE